MSETPHQIPEIPVDPEAELGVDNDVSLAAAGIARNVTEKGQITRIIYDIEHGEPPELTAPTYNGDPKVYVDRTWRHIADASSRLPTFSVSTYTRSLPPAAATIRESWLEEQEPVLQALRAHDGWRADGNFNRLLLPYLSGTLSLLIDGPHDIARQTYHQARVELVRSLSLPLDAAKRASLIRFGRLTVDMAEEIKRRVAQLPHVMPTADYVKMEPEQQEGVTNRIAGQVLKFWTYATRYGDPVLLEGLEPVLIRPVSELDVLMAYATDPRRAFRSYMLANSSESTRNAFLEQLASARNAAKRGAQRFDRDHSPLAFVDQLRALEPNDILTLNKAGNMIPISKLHEHVNLLNDGVVAIIADGLSNTSRVRWDGKAADAVGRLLGKHAGSITEVRIQCLSVDAEKVNVALRRTGEPLSLDRAYGYRLTANLKSSGKPEIPVSVDCILYVANDQRSVYRTTLGRVEGAEARELWLKNSVDTARMFEAVWLLSPHSGGGMTPK
ncbi:MAG TPA: hypothetical protein VLG92_02615 [Candidatus Saccharimonadia bacterium]|nr:hypothetical protein [Candidatus Saccharimonadia bacterium]